VTAATPERRTTVRHDPGCNGRGCPACTGWTWDELRAEDESERKLYEESRDDHEHEWRTR
jgi:hypothetical protein